MSSSSNSGDWELAGSEGIRAVDLADAKGYDRVAVRTWFALIPIAEARHDTPLLARAADWFASRRGTFPTSPYGNVMRAAVDLRLAGQGLAPAPELEPRTLIEDLGLAETAPSWLAAVERIVGGWLDRDLRGVAAEAIERYRTVEAGPIPGLLAASRSLVAAMAAGRAGQPAEATQAARTAVSQARAAHAPWWTLRSLRLLDEAGAASADDRRELAAIERGLIPAARARPNAARPRR